MLTSKNVSNHIFFASFLKKKITKYRFNLSTIEYDIKVKYNIYLSNMIIRSMDYHKSYYIIHKIQRNI